MTENNVSTLYQIYEASNVIADKSSDINNLSEFMQPICARCEADDWVVFFNSMNSKEIRAISPKGVDYCSKESLVDFLPVLFSSGSIEEISPHDINQVLAAINQPNCDGFETGIYSSFEVNPDESVILLLMYAKSTPSLLDKHLVEFEKIKQFISVFISASFSDDRSNNLIDELRTQIRRQNTWMEALGWINQAKVNETQEHSTKKFYKELLFQLSTLMNANEVSLFEVEDGEFNASSTDKSLKNIKATEAILNQVIANNELSKQSVWSKTQLDVGYLERNGIAHLVLYPLFKEAHICSILCVIKYQGEFDVNDKSIGRLFADGVEKIIERRWFLGKINDKNLALENEKNEQKLLVKKLNDTKEQLLQNEKMASIGQLAAGVAHEINNPVGYVASNITSLTEYINDLFRVIDNYEKLDKDGADNSTQFEVIEKIKKEVDLTFIRDDVGDLLSESLEGVSRVKQIVQDLKDFSHSDKIVWKSTDLHKGIDSTLNIVANELKYNVDIVKEYGDIPMVECMPSQINQVLMNLFVNAGHAIDGQGSLTITTGLKDEDHISIQVADSGKGIEPENLKRIFDPFFTTKEIGKGTGLGLSLSYGIIEKHSGHISVTSELGVGTTFTIILPLKQAVEAEQSASTL